jgi:small subunit ribosomal protein S5
MFNIETWAPLTEVGRKVKSHEITSIEQIFAQGKKIEETEIVDALLLNIKNEIIEIESVQRMTKNNRKQKFRVTAIVGDGNGHVGVGLGKDSEVKAAIDSAVKDAKRNITPIMLGCGSWQCNCGTEHSIPFTVKGRCGGVDVVLKPAPRGTGVVASVPIRKMLELAGVKDIWSSSRGHTKARYNTLEAVSRAIHSMISMKNIEEKA